MILAINVMSLRIIANAHKIKLIKDNVVVILDVIVQVKTNAAVMATFGVGMERIIILAATVKVIATIAMTNIPAIMKVIWAAIGIIMP